MSRVGLLAVGWALALAFLAPTLDAEPNPPPLAPFEMKPSQRGGKFKFEGPFSIGDPVHETITIQALRAEGLLAPSQSDSAAAAVDFIRGVFWNDDPKCDLFLTDNGLLPSLGVRWLSDFRAAENGEATALKTLVGRSHFGDLQFLHGMAAQDGELPESTRTAALAWAELAYRLAIGDLAVDRKLDTLGLAAGDALVRGGTSFTAMALFHAQRPDSARQRALGSLLHLLQDSYAPGHVEREKTRKGERGAIIEFHSYSKQDHDKHGKDDGWRGGKTGMDKIRALAGGVEALRESRSVLAFYSRNAPWSEVEPYLEQGPLKLARNARPATPGADYGKSAAP